MKTCVILLLFWFAGLFLPARAMSFSDLSGEWRGYITQHPSPFDTVYQFRAIIHVDSLGVQGKTFISINHEPFYYGWLKFKGWIREDKVYLKEYAVEEFTMVEYGYWCLKMLILQLSMQDGRMILTGPWQSDHCSGSTGIVYLERLIS